MIFEPDVDTSRHVALFAARMVAGILFIAQGYDKLFVLGISKVMEPFTLAFSNKKIPASFLHIAILLSTLIEFSGGLFLALGLMRDLSLYLLLINMIGVAAGFCLIRPIWDMQHYFPRFLLLLLIILLPPEWDLWRLDSLFN